MRCSAKQAEPCECLVRQWFSGPGGTTGATVANGRRGGSALPENGPRLRKRSIRGGHSRDLSLQAGPGGCGGTYRGRPRVGIEPTSRLFEPFTGMSRTPQASVAGLMNVFAGNNRVENGVIGGAAAAK